MPIKGNEEYQRLLNLYKNNPLYKTMLDSISKAEGTWNKDSYSTKYGGKKVDWRKGKDRKSDGTSNAHGKYQFMNETWDGLAKELGITGFSPEEQEVAALKLLERAGSLKHLDEGNLEKAIYSASGTWAALPKNAKGESALKFKDGTPQKAKPVSKILSYMGSNEKDRAKINDSYSDLNKKKLEEHKSNSFDFDDDSKKIYDTYNAKKAKIYRQDGLSPNEKKAKIQELNRDEYRKGNMLVINTVINKRNRAYESLISDISDKANTFENESLDPMFVGKRAQNNITNAAEFERLQKRAKVFGISLKDPKFNVLGGDKKDKDALRFVSPQYMKKVLGDFKKNVKLPEMEKGLLKYGQTKDEYERSLDQGSAPDNELIESLNEDGTIDLIEDDGPSASKIANDKAVADRLAQQALEDKKKVPEFSEFKKYDDAELGMQADTQFKYTPGKAKIPYEAFGSLAMGIAGMNAADVDIEYRDEQVGEGLRQYIADISKIKNMGLSPEEEGALKTKIASAYQTGLNNIVKASGGNRNLVLGNQGQLDASRMASIAEIATLDSEKREKALTAFGEAQKYISEFDAKRDIANNDRKYLEDQKKQIAGAQLASSAMSNFIDTVQYAKENGPGSVNDMKRQLSQFHITGLLKGARPGEPGSPEFAAAATLRNNEKQDLGTSFNKWKNSKTREEQDVIHNVLLKHPEKDPLKNSEATLEDLITFTDEVTGDAEYKSEYQKYLGISELTSRQIKEDVASIKGEDTPEEKQEQPKEKQYADANTPVVPIETKGINNTAGKNFTGQPELKGKTAVHRPDRQQLAKDGYHMINGSLVPIQGAIVGKDGLADSTIQDGLNNSLVTGKGLTPDQINDNNNQQQYIKETAKRMDDSMAQILEINKKAEEREIIFNESQAVAKAKLDLVMPKR